MSGMPFVSSSVTILPKPPSSVTFRSSPSGSIAVMRTSFAMPFCPAEVRRSPSRRPGAKLRRFQSFAFT